MATQQTKAKTKVTQKAEKMVTHQEKGKAKVSEKGDELTSR